MPRAKLMLPFMALLAATAAAQTPAPKDAWTAIARSLGIEAEELAASSQGLELAFLQTGIEDFLNEPVNAPAMLERAKTRIDADDGVRGLLFVKRMIMTSLGAEPPYRKTTPFACPDIPDPMRSSIEGLASRLRDAQELVARAADSLAAPSRARADALREALTTDGEGPLDEELFARLKGFDQAGMERAADRAALAVDDALPALEEAAKKIGPGRWTCSTPSGPVIVSGSGDDSFDAALLERALAVVHLGGRGRYAGPAAAAEAGQLRVVIDLGQAVVESTGPAAGGGDFGVGLMYLPHASSSSITAGDFSAGAGFFGVGALSISGDGVAIKTGRFGQGAGAFGAGIFSARGRSLRAEADLSSQGFGFTQGGGFFVVRGDSATLRCGLVDADPREPLAFLSLCQGVGYGPRAYAAGGVGILRLAGDDARLTSSYFAQGAGYWHALGGAMISGRRNRAQARRYSQGSGVHAGAGALLAEGDGNSFFNWGVGPAYGWDAGVGLMVSSGSTNSFQADWAAGRAEYNGRSLAYVDGDGNALTMPGLGTANFKRGAAAYGLAFVAGRGNRLRVAGLAAPATGAFDLMASPWGVARFSGEAAIDPGLKLERIDWPGPDRQAQARREKERWDTLRAAAGSGQQERLDLALAAATRFAFEPEAQDFGLRFLSSLDGGQAPLLLERLTPQAFDEGLWVRLAFSALGRQGAAAVLSALSEERAARKALLLGLTRFSRAQDAVAASLQALGDSDWRTRREAAGVLGAALGREKGEEPGRLAALEAIRDYLKEADAARLAKRLGVKRPPDLLSYLALGGVPSAETRLRLLASCPGPFDPVDAKAVQEFARALSSSPASRGAVEEELAQAALLAPQAARALRRALEDPQPQVRQAALVSLGSLGYGADARRLADFLDDPSALLRDAAALGLSRLGPAGARVIKQALKSSRPSIRMAAVAAAAQSWDEDTVLALEPLLSARDERTRLAAVAALSAFQNTTMPRQKDFLPALRRLRAADASPSARASAAAALANLEPVSADAP